MRLLLSIALIGRLAASAQPASFAAPLHLAYRIEWRMVDAGGAILKWSPAAQRGGQANVHIQSQGLVSKLYKVNDNYSTNLDEKGCTISTSLLAEEGSRRKQTLVTYDRVKKKVQYSDKDLVKNTTDNREIDIPGCAFDVIGALVELRRQTRLEPGMAFSMPVSDGKKFVDARVEVQAKEKVKTPLGEFNTIRTEAFLFDGALYARKARLHVWFTDDAERLPVQIRVSMRLYIGNVTLQAEKRL